MGSYNSAALPREGFDTVYTLSCRYHIGESPIPSVRHCLKLNDAEDKVELRFRNEGERAP